MSIPTSFTELFHLTHPIALAPMGGVAGGALAAAVSNGGGLGIVGGGQGEPEWLDRELAIAAEQTERPWGVGFLSWAVNSEIVRNALERQPAAVLLSFGDPGSLAEPVKRAGTKLIVQVTDVDEARRALEVGADVLVAQGGEAGGHGGGRATLPFIPAVVDLAGGTPVLAAGGITDGRGLAAALVLGAAGALVGTRFEATPEALVDEFTRNAIVESGGEGTERRRVLDIARNVRWPSRYPARTLRNAFLEEWRGREDELEHDESAKERFHHLLADGDPGAVPVWAGEGIDLITRILPAADLVRMMAADAEAALTRVRPR